MLAVTWIAIFLAALSTWSPALRWMSLGLLVVGYGAALANGQLDLLVALPLALLLLAAYAVSPHRPAYFQYIGHALFIALALALCMHWLPGFHNPRVIGPERFSADAVPFTMYLNLDKPLAGFWLLLVLPWTRHPQVLRLSIKAGVSSMLVTTVACMLIAVLLGIVKWEPKFPIASWLWLLNNLLLVTLTEEVIFRGYLQGGIRRLLKQRPYADVLAISVSAVLFGLAHFGGGWPWILLGSVAGLGYGVAYRFGGLQAAVFAHFGVNVLHFVLFTYPMLQTASPR